MINYGVVYPQAILIFVVTMLYSVIQPTILIFGALYFGIGYLVYKYKLLFGTRVFMEFINTGNSSLYSVLQTVRVPRPSLADHFCASYLGHFHFPNLYDWPFHPQESSCPVLSHGSTIIWYLRLVRLHKRNVQTT